MSVCLIIKYEGKFFENEYNEGDTIKTVMRTALNHYKLALYYTSDQYTFTMGNKFLNKDEAGVNKTIKDWGLEDDDNLFLVATTKIDPGNYIKINH